jgi:PTS system nitrogen regulatory IIA component
LAIGNRRSAFGIQERAAIGARQEPCMDRIQAVREVMTLEEVAEYLQVSEKSVLRMAQSGKIPAAKVANQWRFMRSVVDDWLMAQMEIPSVRSAPARKEPPKLPSLTQLIPPSAMNLLVTPGPKEDILRQLVEPLRASRLLRQTRRFLESVQERERLVSTGIGHGIAIPHPRRPVPGLFKEPLVGLGVCREGTDFEALDHQRTYVFFLLCAPTEDVQLRLLARVIQFGRNAAALDSIKRAAATPGESGAAGAVTAILRSADEASGTSRPCVPRAEKRRSQNAGADLRNAGEMCKVLPRRGTAS